MTMTDMRNTLAKLTLLGAVELRCVEMFTDRIYMGQQAFGEFEKTAREGRSWPQEILEEQLDASVYACVAMETMRQRVDLLEQIRQVADELHAAIDGGMPDDRVHEKLGSLLNAVDTLDKKAILERRKP